MKAGESIKRQKLLVAKLQKMATIVFLVVMVTCIVFKTPVITLALLVIYILTWIILPVAIEVECPFCKNSISMKSLGEVPEVGKCPHCKKRFNQEIPEPKV